MPGMTRTADLPLAYSACKQVTHGHSPLSCTLNELVHISIRLLRECVRNSGQGGHQEAPLVAQLVPRPVLKRLRHGVMLQSPRQLSVISE